MPAAERGWSVFADPDAPDADENESDKAERPVARPCISRRGVVLLVCIYFLVASVVVVLDDTAAAEQPNLKTAKVLGNTSALSRGTAYTPALRSVLLYRLPCRCQPRAQSLQLAHAAQGNTQFWAFDGPPLRSEGVLAGAALQLSSSTQCFPPPSPLPQSNSSCPTGSAYCCTPAFDNGHLANISAMLVVLVVLLVVLPATFCCQRCRPYRLLGVKCGCQERGLRRGDRSQYAKEEYDVEEAEGLSRSDDQSQRNPMVDNPMMQNPMRAGAGADAGAAPGPPDGLVSPKLPPPAGPPPDAPPKPARFSHAPRPPRPSMAPPRVPSKPGPVVTRVRVPSNAVKPPPSPVAASSPSYIAPQEDTAPSDDDTPRPPPDPYTSDDEPRPPPGPYPPSDNDEPHPPVDAGGAGALPPPPAKPAGAPEVASYENVARPPPGATPGSKKSREAAFFAAQREHKEKAARAREAELAAMSPDERQRVEAAEQRERQHSDAKKAMLKKQMGGGVYKGAGKKGGKVGGRSRGRRGKASRG